MNEDELFLKCSCGVEGCLISKYEDDIHLAIFTCGYGGYKISFFKRFRYILNVLFTGKPYEDQIVLNKTEVKKLIEYLQNHIK